MKVCLINPPWEVKKGSIWSQVRSSMPALGLLYIAAYLESKGIECDVLDFQATLASQEEIEATIKIGNYDFYGITATTPLAHNAYRISKFIKREKTGAKVVLGGVHPTALPEESFVEGDADYVVRGEGEEIFYRLISGENAAFIDGISYVKDGKVMHVGSAGIVHDLDSLPYPAFHKVDLSLYKPAVGGYKRTPAINMTATRGCPGKCTFCNSAAIKLRKRSAQHIFGEMEMLVREYGIKEICFYDDTFTVYPENIKQLCALIVENGLDITWSCFARTDCVNDEMLEQMKRAGCHQVMYGIESASPQILINIKKPIQKEKNVIAVALARKHGITSRCTFMLGNPGETPETIDETIDFALELDPDIALFNITVPYPGTEMFDWADKNGYLLTKDWREYDLSVPVMSLPDAPVKTLQLKYKEAFRRFYFRPIYVLRQVKRLLSISELRILLEGIKSLLKFAKS